MESDDELHSQITVRLMLAHNPVHTNVYVKIGELSVKYCQQCSINLFDARRSR